MKKLLKEGLADGNLKFVLKGKKLKGEFALVRLKDTENESWLLIKHRDKYSTDDDYDSEDETPKNSPINRWIEEHKPGYKPKRVAIKKEIPPKKEKLAKKEPKKKV